MLISRVDRRSNGDIKHLPLHRGDLLVANMSYVFSGAGQDIPEMKMSLYARE